LIFSGPLFLQPLHRISPGFLLGAVGLIKMTVGLMASIDEPELPTEGSADHHGIRESAQSDPGQVSALSQSRPICRLIQPLLDQ